jgi:hypothetical protein
VYYFLASCLLVFGHRHLDAFFENFQDLEAEDFEQWQGGKRQVLFTVRPTLVLYLCLHEVKLNIICLHMIFHVT